MLVKYPPQTSSREAASQWGCFVHNVVNERLNKPIFDCNEISDKYNCGCGPDDKKEEDDEDSEYEGETSTTGSKPERRQKSKVDAADLLDVPEVDAEEGLVRGG